MFDSDETCPLIKANRVWSSGKADLGSRQDEPDLANQARSAADETSLPPRSTGCRAKERISDRTALSFL